METKIIRRGFQIAVLDKGFVYVGDCEIADGWLKIENARNIRRWGTTLGDLALDGPKENTILDNTGVVNVPFHSVVSLIDTEKKKWNK